MDLFPYVTNSCWLVAGVISVVGTQGARGLLSQARKRFGCDGGLTLGLDGRRLAWLLEGTRQLGWARQSAAGHTATGVPRAPIGSRTGAAS
jgi:hypothetical protein